MSRSRRKGQDGPLEIGGRSVHPSDRIGSYVFVREVGSGGMARVLLARDPSGELAALKVLRRNRFKTGLPRFRREFRALSRLNHPNVVRVDAYGDLHGHPFIAMEYVDGPDLHSTIRGFRTWEKAARWRRCEEILVDLCRALAATHRRGLVHRDLKPSNVLISRDGVCKLTDFGIVKDLDPTQDPVLSTTLVGTWAYTSPEQIQGNSIDHRSDLYSLGIILFAMLTGKRPFVARDMQGYLELHRDRPAPAPREVYAAIPAHLDEICRRLLQKAPRDRFQSAQEILYRLEAEDRVPVEVAAGGWEPPLVGRDLELEVLGNALGALTTGRGGGFVVLEGEDGAGKTRLLGAGCARAESLGFPFQRHEFDSGAPAFSGVRRIVRDLVRELGDQVSRELRERLEPEAEDEPRGDARYALYDAVRELFELAADNGPRLLALDDLHSASANELDLLAYLLRTVVEGDSHPLLVLATLRPKANGAADQLAAGQGIGLTARDVTVGPLSPEALDSIVIGMVGDSKASRTLSRRLHRETEGNAYFVTEFLRSLIAGKVIDHKAGTWQLVHGPDQLATDHLEIPIGVRQVMKARLAGLEERDKGILQALAVGGREVDLDVLLEILDEDEEPVLDGLDRLLAAGIVRERRAGERLFHGVTHRKFADVVYRDLNPDRRAELHRRAGAALEMLYAEDPGALEVVGEHYRLAGDAGRAYRYLIAAARRLLDRSLTQEAWELCEKVAAIEDSARDDLPPDDFRTFQRDHFVVRASVHYNRAEWEEAEKIWRAILRSASDDDDARAASEARLRLATTLRRRGQYADSGVFAHEALEAARRLHYRHGVAEALHCIAALAWADGNLDECERLANEGLLVAQDEQLAEQRAELLLALTAAQATRGHLASATRGLVEAESIFRELRMKRPRCLALANIAELLTWRGEPLQARQRARSAVELAHDVDYKLGHTAALRASSIAALDLGVYDEAQNGLHDALEVARAIALSEEVLACLVGLTRLCLERGDISGACKHAARALEVAETHDPERYLLLVRALLARALAGSRPEGARSLLQAVVDGSVHTPVPRRTQVQIEVGWAWAALDEKARARGVGRTVLQVAGSRGFALLRLEARALLSVVSTGDDRDAHRAAGQQLARTFAERLPPDLRRSFARRPFLKHLE